MLVPYPRTGVFYFPSKTLSQLYIFVLNHNTCYSRFVVCGEFVFFFLIKIDMICQNSIIFVVYLRNRAKY